MTDLELALKRIEKLESRCIGLEQYAIQLKKENVSIEDLEQKNKVLVDFLNDMEIKFSSYGFFFVANRVPKDKAFEVLDIIKPNCDYVKQLKKALLELVEEQE